MIKIRKKITNPMTVIAIFAFISESSAAISLPFLDNDEREVYIWFLISFPFYLLLLFFLTLNFNYRSLYAPSDFDKDDSFLKVFDELKQTENIPCSSPARGAPGGQEWTLPERGIDQRPLHPCGADESCPERAWIEHTIQLPKSMGTLRAIDVRPLNSTQAFNALAEHFPQLGKQSAKAVVFLTDSASDALLKQITLSLVKQAKKNGGAKLFVAYNVSTQSTTVLRGE
ncbi:MULTISPECIES: hypothetical protein [Pseudomonas]|jgi:hypothetical protein|uniref:Uncharacterized protein n=1 Tax=Pseudomonas fluorescens R124 TaxID=743713 RepID=A0A7U9CQN0_PSEFL|nr:MULTISPECIES: hypothetical protein [Pseudomonas]EJZ59773.1 hypothetical protein I1A_004126 [Pseudomonas fluorescens R124]MCU1772344.1 hypothetical protein [Pseudomonas sp. 13B_3.2_Bac1]